MRGFKRVEREKNSTFALPKRATTGSAGYDLCCIEDIELWPYQYGVFKTGVKAYMPSNEVLILSLRSSVSTKKELMLSNGIGVIDSDYYGNAKNDGEILIPIRNLSDTLVTIPKGERIAQGIFVKYGVTDDDTAEGVRNGGMGSTGK